MTILPERPDGPSEIEYLVNQGKAPVRRASLGIKAEFAA
ncbi:hypothetical protein P3T35_004664 [Kitasatospora sp. GP30]|jgi:hypothetical protein|nr:hypothetical protein [Kitasatospora sp. GP30]